MMIYRLVTLMFLLMAGFVRAESDAGAPPDYERNYWGERAEGWFWYKDPPAPAKKKPAKKTAPATSASAATTKEQKALEEFKALQQRVEETQKIAIMYPTPENAKAFMVAFQEAKDRASTFTDVVQRVKWVTPELDYNFRGRPTNPSAMAVYDQEDIQHRDNAVRKLAKTHGLFFFFRSNCPYCHAMAPMVQQFQARYGVTVFPISLDGGPLPQFPNAQPDNGIAARLGVTQVPATFMAVPSDGEIVPIGFGVMNADEMATRLYELTSIAPGAR